MYKNNSELIAKTKVSKYKKDLCLTKKLVREKPLLFLYKTVMPNKESSEYIIHYNSACNLNFSKQYSYKR